MARPGRPKIKECPVDVHMSFEKVALEAIDRRCHEYNLGRAEYLTLCSQDKQEELIAKMQSKINNQDKEIKELKQKLSIFDVGSEETVVEARNLREHAWKTKLKDLLTRTLEQKGMNGIDWKYLTDIGAFRNSTETKEWYTPKLNIILKECEEKQAIEAEKERKIEWLEKYGHIIGRLYYRILDIGDVELTFLEEGGKNIESLKIDLENYKISKASNEARELQEREENQIKACLTSLLTEEDDKISDLPEPDKSIAETKNKLKQIERRYITIPINQIIYASDTANISETEIENYLVRNGMSFVYRKNKSET